VVAGETWTYRVRDGFTGLERGSRNYRVTGAAGDRMEVRVSLDGGTREEIEVYDRGWNGLRHPATNLQSFEYAPRYPAFAFPLTPGKQWRERLTATDPADGRRFAVVVAGTVLGWERIRVPAGEFDAIKVKREVFFDYWEYSVRDRSIIEEYDWYAPAVKWVVRREASSQYLSYLFGAALPFVRVSREDGGIGYVKDDWLISELTAYSVR
jgi:hypothetical protein